MSAGRPLEPAGNGRPRWMAAAGANPSGYASRTESGVQVDSSVAHQASRRHTVAGLLIPRVPRSSSVILGRRLTAQPARRRPRAPSGLEGQRPKLTRPSWAR